MYILLIHCLFTLTYACARKMFVFEPHHTYVPYTHWYLCRTYALYHEVFRFKFQHVSRIEMFFYVLYSSHIFSLFLTHFLIFYIRFDIHSTLCRIHHMYRCFLCNFSLAMHWYTSMWSQWKRNKTKWNEWKKNR